MPAADVTLLLGGARSGKSALSVELGRRFVGTVVFVATAEAGDDDMALRIRRHRDDRPPWDTIEEPIEIVDAITGADPQAMLIVDCLTLWVANMLFADRADDEIQRCADTLADALAARRGPTVVISNEVGMGIHPEHALGRRYRDLLGTVNQVVARRATRTLLLVAGRAIELHDPITVIEGRHT